MGDEVQRDVVGQTERDLGQRTHWGRIRNQKNETQYVHKLRAGKFILRRVLICPLVGARFDAQKGVILVRSTKNTSLKRGYLKTGVQGQ